MSEIGIDLRSHRPRQLSDDDLHVADVVVTMGCGDTCPVFPGRRYIDWAVDDPAGQDLEAVRRIRDEIERRVSSLVSDVLAAND
jgi:arsenate reductase